jgi:bla regulator protein blaR1
MIAAFTDHLWQSTIFVLAAALIAAALRHNRAHIRHRIWLIASLKFLLPLSLLMSIGRAFPQAAPSPATDAPASVSSLSITVDRIAQPFTSDVFIPITERRQADSNALPMVLGVVWAIGFMAVVAMRVRGWQRVRSALRSSTVLRITAPVAVRSSAGLLEPGVVGFWRPVLLVPEGLEQQLTPRQLEAVLLHEWCHIQRRDNLTSAVHMLVEAVFWFHPLVWFVGARLVDERERACDEFVLRIAGDPSAYAESILNVCKLYVESPVACVSGVTGADLKNRIATILTNRVGLQLTSTQRVALTMAACVAVVLPVMAGVLTAPLRAASGATAGQGSPKFDVVSVKPCPPDMPGQLRTGGGSPITSPGRLYLQCYRVSSLITEAYLFFADGKAHTLSSTIDVGVEGGPSWISSERFLIEATGPRDAAPALMRGPMLQAILEDRFKLKIRRVSREMPVYELVAATSGAKVAPYKGTDCVIKDAAAWPPPALPEGQRYCGDRSRIDGDMFIREGVMTLDEMASLMPFDHPVVNKTGITAPVSYRYDLPRTELRGDAPPSGAYLSVLRSQLGLDLRLSKGPRDFLVIDSVERPTPNDPTPVR